MSDCGENRSQLVLANAIKEFRRDVEITRDVRFQANLRLSARQRGSSYIVSLLSLYVIAISLMPNILELKPFQNQLLLACSIVLSVFVIFTSLIDGAQNFFHQGELLHQCARKISTVYHDVKNIDIDSDPAIAWSELRKLQAIYRSALDECPTNHDNVDFFKEKSLKPHLFSTNWPYSFKFPYIIYNRFLSFVLRHSWMIPHIIALVGVNYILYKYIIIDAVPVSK